MTDTADKLLRCPFCGGEASDAGYVFYRKPCEDIAWEDGSPITEAFFCNCPACGISNMASNIGYRTKAQAIAAWNRRDLAALPAQGWRVKPLVWETHWTGGWQREFAKTPVGLEYHVNDQGWWFPADNLRICADRQKAKAAAQADYEARILAALEPAEAGGVEVDWGADVGREVLPSPVDAGGVEAMAEGTLE
jgi:hypothetical protein